MAAVDTTLALVSLADVKEQLKITAGSTEDSILSALINEASALANSVTGRYLLSKAHVEYYDGDGTRKQRVRQYPITAVTTIHDDTARVFGSNALVPAANIITEDALGLAAGVIELYGAAFTKGIKNIKVSYTAGWALASVPQDLQLGVKKLVVIQYQKYKTMRHDANSQNLGDHSLVFDAKEMPADVAAMLARHRRIGGMS